ncbi:hypothetical protein Poli38472_014080 [Pythium oligandrum]|uniref:Fucosyltransferase n=1 Tax=Pythium oligandrum TaxID=41045 RepID=A0A8K1CPR8_PYTOL|nr:hypothetical protein Poli38472_014080 [Pythium oligandrum]|eukprot:TMW66768.1 hypothetical protein Poli38472_014080 [Pythium oligandrum]
MTRRQNTWRWLLLCLCVAASTAASSKSDTGLNQVAVDSSTTARRVVLFNEELQDDGWDRRDILVIGVKTSVIDGVDARRAIRETWANAASLPVGVRVLFAGCEPDLSMYNESKRHSIRKEIRQEKQLYGDLLTDELQCRDSYEHLVEKTVAFFRFASSHWHFAYLMVADDDIYLRVDKLVDLLHQNASTEGFYAGQVWSTHYNRSIHPQRDPSHKNYLSIEEYPSEELPSFANGPFYLLSVDCVHFIVQHQPEFRNVGSLEDVSVALWLQKMNVFPVHIPQFANLKDTLCRNDLVALADATSNAIREIQTNLVNESSFCSGFTVDGWFKRQPDPIEETDARWTDEWNILRLDWSLEFDEYDRSIHLPLRFTHRGGVEPLTLDYVPSGIAYPAFCYLTHDIILSWFSLPNRQPGLCSLLREYLEATISRTWLERPSFRPFLTLFYHNIHGKTFDTTVLVGYSDQASYSKTVFECLFSSMFRGAQVIFFSEKLLKLNHKAPDVFVFSILDGGCGDAWEQPCRDVTSTYLTRYSDSKLVMISGEAWMVDGISESVLLVSTVQDTRHARHLYVPQASTSFGERLEHSPNELLKPTHMRYPTYSNRRFCAYMYARCDRPHREYMFDLLNEVEAVDALGACQGASNGQNLTRLRGRHHPFYNDEGVFTFSNYKFVIAFETAQVPGYVTEKLVNAFLAGTVPIYFGHSASVSHIFNPRSFIDCGRFARLRDCAAFVLRVHRDEEIYEQFRKEPPIQNVTAFNEIFSWHPDVGNTMMADQMLELINTA